MAYPPTLVNSSHKLADNPRINAVLHKGSVMADPASGRYPASTNQAFRGMWSICETAKVKMPAQKRHQGVVNLRRSATARETGMSIISRIVKV
jgi:hypothetical protein